MQQVFVVDATRRPLMPCRPARARRLLTQHRAAVLRRYPFTIILTAAMPEAVVAPVRLKIDPGSRTTGLAMVSHRPTPTSVAVPVGRPPRSRAGAVVWAADLAHRGDDVHNALVDRRAVPAPAVSVTLAIVPPALPTGPDLMGGCHPRWRVGSTTS